MRVHVDPDDIEEVDADNRGRVSLGPAFYGAEGIEIAVLNRDEITEE